MSNNNNLNNNNNNNSNNNNNNNNKSISPVRDAEGYKYLGIFRERKYLTRSSKREGKEGIFRQRKKIVSSNLNGNNSTDALNTRAISIMRYSAGIVDWKKTSYKM